MLVIIHLSPPPAPTHPSPQSNDGWDTLALGLGGLSYKGVDCVQLSPTDSDASHHSDNFKFPMGFLPLRISLSLLNQIAIYLSSKLTMKRV